MSPLFNILPRGELKFSVEGLVPNMLFAVNGKFQIFPSQTGAVGLFLVVLSSVNTCLRAF